MAKLKLQAYQYSHGPANAGRILTAAEKAEIEQELRDKKILSRRGHGKDMIGQGRR
jgi:hypothetical protein